MDALDFQKQFSKYKDILIEEIIQEFGEEYRNDIIERINSYVIILQSNPQDDYTYLCKHADKIKFTDRSLIKERYRELEHIKKKARNWLMDEFKWLISAFFKIDENILFQKDSEELVSLFTNQNFDESYIDSYNSHNMNLLNRVDTPEVIKESVLNDQRILKEKLEKFGIIIDENFIHQVDEFIEKRELEKGGYYRRILKSNFGYNKELYELIQEKDPKFLFNISFYQHPHQGIFVMPGEKEIRYVFYPVVRLINQNSKALDTSLIHELVHTIEKDEKYSIMDEIIVQKAAINITRRLHENEIFIFDDKEDSQIEGNCAYETLFPLVEPILNYYELLKNTLVNGSFYSLNEVFGESWNQFLQELEMIFSTYQNMMLRSQRFNWRTDLSNLNKHMEEMDDFYHRGGKHV